MLSSTAASTAAPAMSSMLDLSVDGGSCWCGGRRGCFGQNGPMKGTASTNAATYRRAWVIAGMLWLTLYTSITGNDLRLLTDVTRIVIFALAAARLNLIMGYGGLMKLRPRRPSRDRGATGRPSRG